MTIKFAALSCFVAVIENGSFIAAAGKLGVTKSAVSKRVALLEQDLGVRLLHRTTRKLSLTEAGERYYHYAAQALTVARQAEEAATALQTSPGGKLKVSIPMSLGRLHITPLVPEFLALYPDIRMTMVLEDRVTDLVAGGFDLAIRAGTLPDSSLIATRIAPCRNVLCAAPAYGQHSGIPLHPHQLLNHNCLQYSYFSDNQDWTFQRDTELVTVRTSGNFHVNNSEALLEVLLGGAGIARLPTFIAGKYLKSGQLEQLLPEFSMRQQAIYAVFPERRFLPAKVRAFIDFIAGKLGGERPGWDAF